jgi:hypothetical protein
METISWSGICIYRRYCPQLFVLPIYAEPTERNVEHNVDSRERVESSSVLSPRL